MAEHKHEHGGGGHGEEHHGHDHHQHAAISPAAMDAAQRRAFSLGVSLNLGFCAIEATVAFLAHSMALLSDAVHNLTDVLGLALSWGAFAMAARRPGGRFTYGFKRATILAAFVNGVILLVSAAGLAWESFARLTSEEPVAGWPMILAASAGVAVNAYTAWLFTKGSKSDINMRGAFLHLASDAIVSVGVVITGALLLIWPTLRWLDPVVGLIIVGVIVRASWGLAVEALLQLFDAAPANVALQEVEKFLRSFPGVRSIHDLHVWNLSTDMTAISVHVEIGEQVERDALLAEMRTGLNERFGIRHPTIQLETRICDGEGECARTPQS